LDGLEFSLLREIKLLQELNHPNVVKLYDVFHLKGLLFYALEYGAVDLGDLIMKEKESIILKEEHVKCLMKQILEGLGYLHSNWIMHRDLKPANMVIDENGMIKIIDFNSAKIYGSPNKEHSK
jgi:cyclin-dependent kinase 7